MLAALCQSVPLSSNNFGQMKWWNAKCSLLAAGGFFRRGISGGERKRVSVGHEMIINPSVLLLDEPTSGMSPLAPLFPPPPPITPPRPPHILPPGFLLPYPVLYQAHCIAPTVVEVAVLL